MNVRLGEDPRPSALFISTQHWESHFQIGSHHIARAFAERGWRVGFMSAPISPAHLLGLGEQSGVRLRSWRAGGQFDAASGIWHYVPLAGLPYGPMPLLRGARYGRLAALTFLPRLRTVLRRAGFLAPAVAYTDHFLHQGMLRAARPRHAVFRIADRLSGFPGAGADFDARTQALADTVQTVVYSQARLAAEFPVASGRGLVIRNGVRMSIFRQPVAPPPEYAVDFRPVAVHVGAMDRWVDIELLCLVAKALPQVRVVCIGPVAPAQSQRLRAAGVEPLGPRTHRQLPAYLQHAAVGLVAFSSAHATELVRDIQPLKLYEYLASGLPVVGAGAFDLPAEIAPFVSRPDSAEGFIEAVRAAIAQTPWPDIPDALLADCDWSMRLRPLFERLESGHGGA